MSNLRASASTVKPPRTSNLVRYGNLLFELVKRDFSMRFTGSAFGLAWAVLQPLSLVFLYWFVFTVMIPRNPAFAANNEYVFFLISGLIPWLGFQEGLSRGTTSMVDNAAVVRRLTFRSDVLVVVPNVSAILFELIGLTLFIIFLVVKGGFSLAGLWLLPFAIALQFAIQIGLSWLLAPTYVFFRDLIQLLGFVLSIVFYLSPILYPVAGRFERFFLWNPMTPLLGLFRSALLAAPLPSVGSFVFLLTVSAAGFAMGLLFFRRAQPNLADLL